VDAVKYVQEKEGCTDESAAEQLVTAIVDRALAAQWDDEGGLEPVIPNEFGGTVKICLDGVGFVKRYCLAGEAKPIARRACDYPKLEFVKGAVIDIDFDKDTPYSEVNTLSYIPLLVLKEDMHRWPLEETSAEARKGDAPDFVEVGEAGIAVDHAMRRPLAVQSCWWRAASWQRARPAQP